MDNTYDFIERLSTKEPTPGGGGASAMLGALASALCRDGGCSYFWQEEICGISG